MSFTRSAGKDKEVEKDHGSVNSAATVNDVSPPVFNDVSLNQVQGRNDSSLDRLGHDSIEYQYLTFDTEIATTPVFPDDVNQDALPLPDLTPFANPFEWSPTRKRLVTYLACLVNGSAAYASGAYASPAAQLEREWGISYVAYNVGITIFTLGFGVAPMVLAPFSEISGRRPVFIVSGIVFVICQMWCALANNFGSMLAARLFLGFGGSTFSTMVGGIMADIWVTQERNTPMVLFTGATLFGTGLGPLVSGFLAQNLLWRWVFYVQIMTSGVLVGSVIVFFKETRGSVLLSKKAKVLNQWYERNESAGAIGVHLHCAGPLSVSTPASSAGSTQQTRSHSPVEDGEKSATSSSKRNGITVARLRYRVKSDEERVSLLKMITVSCYRPMHMLMTESVVFWFSLWISFAWAVLYLQFGSIPLVFEVTYGFSLQQTGAVFASMCVGAIVMMVVSIYQDTWAVQRFPSRMNGSPEARLYFTCIQSAFLPISLFWFGWTCYTPSIHWIVPTIAVGVATVGIFSIYLAVFNYSADVYRSYASSALAASGLCRNLLGGSFPLVTRQMFTNLGFPAASSLLGGIALILSLVPWVLVFFGPRIRKRSKIARQFLDEDSTTC